MAPPYLRARNLKNSNIRAFTDICTRLGAVNLAQGLCHVESNSAKEIAIEAYKKALDAGRWQPGYDTYVSYRGIPSLRRSIARKLASFNHMEVDPDENVLVTAGALGAFNCVLEAFLQPGDEAILFQPFYSFHRDQLLVKHMVPRAVSLTPPSWSFTSAELEACVSTRTKIIVVNTPANPCGKVFSLQELSMIAEFCKRHNVIAVTDEVYEFMTFDGRRHISLATLPGMWDRTITISSFGKMLSATGWRVGYAVGPERLLREVGYSNEFETACASTPAQYAVDAALQDLSPFLDQANIFQKKRDALCDALEEAGLTVFRPDGAVYVLLDVSQLMECWGKTNSAEVTLQLIDHPGIGSVPAEDFYLNDRGQKQIRLCFAVKDDLLADAAKR